MDHEGLRLSFNRLGTIACATKSDNCKHPNKPLHDRKSIPAVIGSEQRLAAAAGGPLGKVRCSPHSHSRSAKLHHSCALSRARGGTTLRSAAGFPPSRVLHRFWGKAARRTPRIAWGLALSTGKRLCLEERCRECKQNTRYCGFLLTGTTDSGIFSSAAVIRL